MQRSEHYQEDVLFYFDGKPWALELYRLLERHMEELFPKAIVRVQKTQISFYGRHLFAAVSLPTHRKKDWLSECLLITFGLGLRLDSPRIVMAVEPYPGRWTHHVLFTDEAELDEELLGWLQAAYWFSENK